MPFFWHKVLMTTTTFPTFWRSTRPLHSLFSLNQLAIQHLFRRLSSYRSSSAAPHRDKWPFTNGSCTDKLVGASAALYVNYEHIAMLCFRLESKKCHQSIPCPLQRFMMVPANMHTLLFKALVAAAHVSPKIAVVPHP